MESKLGLKRTSFQGEEGERGEGEREGRRDLRVGLRG